MWATSKSEAFTRQFVVESMMESAYWMGMDQPAKGTILPIQQVDRYSISCSSTRNRSHTQQRIKQRASVRDVEVIQSGLLEVGIVGKAACQAGGHTAELVTAKCNPPQQSSHLPTHLSRVQLLLLLPTLRGRRPTITLLRPTTNNPPATATSATAKITLTQYF